MSLFQRALSTVSGPGGGGLHHELGARDEAVAGRVGEHLDGHFAADAVGLADSCHLKLHLFLCSGFLGLLG